MPEQIAPALLFALNAAQRNVKAAVKRTKHSQYDFWYAKADDVVKVAKEALYSAGLMFFLVSNVYTPAPTVTGPDSGSGKTTLTYCLCLAATGEQMTIVYEVPVCPNKGRPADKAMFASDTEGMAYVLRGILLIARPGLDVNGRREDEPPPAPPQAPPVKPAPPPRAPSRPWPYQGCSPEKLASDMREIAEVNAIKLRQSETLGEISAVMNGSRQSGLLNWLEAGPVFKACSLQLIKLIEAADAAGLDALSASLPRLALPDAFVSEVKARGQKRRDELKALS